MSMKILATSDWHLGNLFHGNDRLPEHKHFLKWLLEQIAEQKPDALLIAGDIFDNGNPSAAAQTVYYEFLADATQLCPNMQVIITAGNHDSASFLNAPKALLFALNVHVIGAATQPIDKEVLLLKNSQGQPAAIVCAVPYLRDRDVRISVDGESSSAVGSSRNPCQYCTGYYTN